MAPSKKSRSLIKRFSSINEVASNRDGENANKSKQLKKKLSDMLGPQWSKEELVSFYEAFRKHGKDWRKVAYTVCNRSMEMVEALYTMNSAYLSLPEGAASVVGLIAMMTVHYCILGGSDSEQESNEDTGASRKQQKIGRGKKSLSYPSKVSDKSLPETLPPHSAASNYGCLSLLKKRRSGSGPRAGGKRTPRVPISNPYAQAIGDKYFSPIRQGLKVKADVVDDDVVHEIALALTKASQRRGSPQVSQTPTRKTETPSPVQNGARMHAESEMTSSTLRGREIDEGGCELSLGSTEADDGDYARNRSCLIGTEGAHALRVSQKGKKYLGKKPEMHESVNNHLEDIKGAFSGTEEGLKQGTGKRKFETEVSNVARSSYKSTRKRSKKVLFSADECSAFDALRTLADLSLMMPETNFDAVTVDIESDEDEEDNIPLVRRIRSIQSMGSAETSNAPTEDIDRGIVQTVDDAVDAVSRDDQRLADDPEVHVFEELAGPSNIGNMTTPAEEEDIQPRTRMNPSGGTSTKIILRIPKSTSVVSAPVLPPAGIKDLVFPEDVRRLEALTNPSQFSSSVAHCFTALQGMLKAGETASQELAGETNRKERLETVVKSLEDQLSEVNMTVSNLQASAEESRKELAGERAKSSRALAGVEGLEAKLKEYDDQLIHSTKLIRKLEKKISDDANRAQQFEQIISQSTKEAKQNRVRLESVNKQLEDAVQKIMMMEGYSQKQSMALAQTTRERKELQRSLAAQCSRALEKEALAKKIEDDYVNKLSIIGGVGGAMERFKLLTQFKNNEHHKWDVDAMLERATYVLNHYQPNKRWTAGTSSMREEGALLEEGAL